MKKEKEKSSLGRKSREKGKRGEREVAGILREHGYAEARRGVQYSGRTGAADVIGLPGWHIEVKRVENFNLISAAAQAERDARAGERWVIFHRPSRKPWISVLSKETFRDLAGGDENWHAETTKKVSKIYETLERAQGTAGCAKRPLVYIKHFTIMYLDDFLNLFTERRNNYEKMQEGRHSGAAQVSGCAQEVHEGSDRTELLVGRYQKSGDQRDAAREGRT